MEKNVAMASFYCLVSKIWKKKGILSYAVVRREKTSLVCVVS